MKKIMKFGVTILGLLGMTGTAQALVMDFGSGTATTTTLETPYTQNGLTMTPLDTGSVGTEGHWDYYRTDSDGFGTTNSDWQAAIHTGNNGEEVRFDFGGAAFDLMSIDIGFIFLNGASSLTGTFLSSAGGNTTTSSVGIIDFTAITGFSNITSFIFSMPLGTGSCSVLNSNCASMFFDDVTFRRYVPPSNGVPEPASLALMAFGLVGLGFRRKRRAA